MCGLCGFVLVDKGQVSQSSALLARMTHTLSHRGPDADGQHCVEQSGIVVGLGHRRLAIIDLSSEANQPLENEDGTIQVVFNGEIYNYRELAHELKSRGHRFRSKSDTEVLVHLYEEYGTACAEHLNGMFAFALFDARQKRLLLARDHLGIKPLFYAFKNGNLYFASEIKALLQVPELTREIDYRALDAYFTLGFTHGPRTIFKDIRRLPPATCLVFQDGSESLKPFWSIVYTPKWELSESETAERLWELLCAAVRRQMISDVPLGAFLSGGVDSSCLVAAMTRVSGGGVDTFSLGFEGPAGDELGFAEIVAKHCHTNHQQFRLTHDMLGILPKLLWHLDEPFFDNSILPTYIVSRMARGNVTVALSGDGGDELFGGYEWTRRDRYRAFYQRLPRYLRTTLGHMMPGSLQTTDEYSRDRSAKAKRFLFDLRSDPEAGFLRRTTVSHAFRQGLYSPFLKSELTGFDAADGQHLLFEQAPVADDLDRMCYVDMRSYLPNDCLFKVDRMSMAHGLEVRVPFLDLEVVEFAARIPANMKIRGFTSKYILKRAVAGHLPARILEQRKQGFTVPIGIWLQKGLAGLASRILCSESLRKRELFNQDQIRWMLAGHQNGRLDMGHRLWSLVVFEIWARLFLDEQIREAPVRTLEEMAL